MPKRPTYKKYFSSFIFCLVTTLSLVCNGCKQLSHTEKDKRVFGQGRDTTSLMAMPTLPIRYHDTIVLFLNPISPDTLPLAQNDSIPISDSIALSMDAFKTDSLLPDTLKPRSKRPVKAKRSDSAIEVQVICSASDSSYRDISQKKIYYYGNAEAKYDDIIITAGCLEFDLESSTCRARGIVDSLGILQGQPIFKQGESTFEAKEMLYNFKTKKGIITKVRTEERDGYLHGERIKRMEDNTINIRTGGYTTCDLKTHPHYQFKFTKAKVIPDDKIVTGPIYLTVGDVPLPLALPFAIIPNTKGKKSGLIIPTYGESANRGFYLE